MLQRCEERIEVKPRGRTRTTMAEMEIGHAGAIWRRAITHSRQDQDKDKDALHRRAGDLAPATPDQPSRNEKYERPEQEDGAVFRKEEDQGNDSVGDVAIPVD